MGTQIDFQYDSERECRQAIELDPWNVEAHVSLGSLMREQGRLSESFESYRRAVDLSPNSAAALTGYAESLLWAGDFNRAAAACESAIAGLPPVDYGRAELYLAVSHHLRGESEKCGDLMSSCSNGHHNSHACDVHHDYCCYLYKLSSWYKANSDNLKTRSEGLDRLYVIGESHSLESHGISVHLDGRERLCEARWIWNCMQWHLANSENNFFKSRFEDIISHLPRESDVLLTIGEIDCRNNAGILPYSRKSGISIKKSMMLICYGYLDYVLKVMTPFGHRVIVQGVPSPNVDFSKLSTKEGDELIGLIRDFNVALKKRATSLGFDYLDVYALTDDGSGISNKKWHIDYYHLSPLGTVEAFAQHHVRAR
jgi:tetratricopeptide (TPR) repeat protein